MMSKIVVSQGKVILNGIKQFNRLVENSNKVVVFIKEEMLLSVKFISKQGLFMVRYFCCRVLLLLMVQFILVWKNGYLNRFMVRISNVSCQLNLVLVWVEVIRWLLFMVVVVINMFGLSNFINFVKDKEVWLLVFDCMEGILFFCWLLED